MSENSLFILSSKKTQMKVKHAELTEFCWCKKKTTRESPEDGVGHFKPKQSYLFVAVVVVIYITFFLKNKVGLVSLTLENN